jgi:hypothetical protein
MQNGATTQSVPEFTMVDSVAALPQAGECPPATLTREIASRLARLLHAEPDAMVYREAAYDPHSASSMRARHEIVIDGYRVEVIVRPDHAVPTMPTYLVLIDGRPVPIVFSYFLPLAQVLATAAHQAIIRRSAAA